MTPDWARDVNSSPSDAARSREREAAETVRRARLADALLQNRVRHLWEVVAGGEVLVGHDVRHALNGRRVVAALLAPFDECVALHARAELPHEPLEIVRVLGAKE